MQIDSWWGRWELADGNSRTSLKGLTSRTQQLMVGRREIVQTNKKLLSPRNYGEGSFLFFNFVEPSAPQVFLTSTLYFAAMHSTSTKAFFGKVFTAMAERAGNGSLKNSA